MISNKSYRQDFTVKSNDFKTSIMTTAQTSVGFESKSPYLESAFNHQEMGLDRTSEDY